MFDLELIKKNYKELSAKIENTKKHLNRASTLSEKILYAHLFQDQPVQDFKRGIDYVDFAPDRIAMQDATAQMALLQFMQAGRPQVAVPSTVHCDHLIQAKIGAAEDLSTAKDVNKEVYDFLASVSD